MSKRELNAVKAGAMIALDEPGEQPYSLDKVIDHYSPDQTEKIVCTCDEEEDYELETGVTFDSDVIDDPAAYAAFVAWLKENCGLAEV